MTRREKCPDRKKKTEGRKEAERISIHFTRDVIKVAAAMLAVTMATEIVGAAPRVHAESRRRDFSGDLVRITTSSAAERFFDACDDSNQETTRKDTKSTCRRDETRRLTQRGAVRVNDMLLR